MDKSTSGNFTNSGSRTPSQSTERANFLNIVDLVLLAALWGGSFLFMRVASPEFGPIPLIELRVGIATLFLLPILMWRENTNDLKTNWKPLFFMGTISSAIPFCLIAYAMITLSSGYGSIINASTPLWGGLIAWLWIKEAISLKTVIGLIVGFMGIVILTWDSLSAGESTMILATAAGLFSTILYAVGASYTKLKLSGISSLTTATGSQMGAALFLLPFAIWLWPSTSISTEAWIATLILAIGSTGIAFILYFRLLANMGATKSLTVTYLIPVFGMLWGYLFLDESVTVNMLAGCGVILLGVVLATRR